MSEPTTQETGRPSEWIGVCGQCEHYVVIAGPDDNTCPTMCCPRPMGVYRLHESEAPDGD